MDMLAQMLDQIMQLHKQNMDDPQPDMMQAEGNLIGQCRDCVEMCRQDSPDATNPGY